MVGIANYELRIERQKQRQETGDGDGNGNGLGKLMIDRICCLIVFMMLVAVGDLAVAQPAFGKRGLEIAEDAGPPQNHRELAKRLRKFDNRILALQKVIDKKPGDTSGNAELWFKMAESRWDYARFCEQMSSSEHLSDNSNPSSEDMAKHIADMKHCSEKQRLEAIKVMGKLAALTSYPKQDQALFHLGYYQSITGNVRAAGQALTQLVKDFPETPFAPDAYLLLAEHAFEQAMLKQAISFYEKVLRYHESPVALYARYKLAWCRYNLGEYAAALKLFSDVIAESKEGHWKHLRREALRDLVLTYASIGKCEKAESFFKTVAPDDTTEMLSTLALLYVDMGKFTESDFILENLVNSEPDSPKLFGYYRVWVRNAHMLGRSDDLVKRAMQMAHAFHAWKSQQKTIAKEEQKLVPEMVEQLLKDYEDAAGRGIPEAKITSGKLRKVLRRITH